MPGLLRATAGPIFLHPLSRPLLLAGLGWSSPSGLGSANVSIPVSCPADWGRPAGESLSLLHICGPMSHSHPSQPCTERCDLGGELGLTWCVGPARGHQPLTPSPGIWKGSTGHTGCHSRKRGSACLSLFVLLVPRLSVSICVLGTEKISLITIRVRAVSCSLF